MNNPNLECEEDIQEDESNDYENKNLVWWN